jgi:hypothetical protein
MPKNNIDSSPDCKSDDFKRLGWFKGTRAPSGTWPICGAAGQCDYGSDGNAWIAFDRAGDFVYDEEYLYVGPEPLPRDNGDCGRPR